MLAAISPDGKFVLNVAQESDGRQSLWLLNIPTGSVTQVVAPSDGLYRSLQFSPDGNYLYFVHQDEKDKAILDLFRAPVLGGTAQLISANLSSGITFSQPSGTDFVKTTDGLPAVFLNISVSAIAPLGPRNLLVTNSAGELSVFVGGLQVTQ